MQLTVNNLGKQHKCDFWGLKDFCLDIKPGILGLLGPNGAGKSTFTRMLATITKSTNGTISWNGTDVVKSPDVLRDVLGYLLQDFGYPVISLKTGVHGCTKLESGEKDNFVHGQPRLSQDRRA
jgi:ABC-2 type transport system ATP-binding protein